MYKPRVPLTVAATVSPLPVVVFVIERVLSARFIAVIGRVPVFSNYADVILRENFAQCRADPTFALAAALLPAEATYYALAAVFSALLVALLVWSIATKDKLLTAVALIGVTIYPVSWATFDRLCPTVMYYLTD